MNTYEGSAWLIGRRLAILQEMEEPGDYTPEERLGSALASMNETILCLIGKSSSGLPGIMGQATTALKIQGLMDAIRNERDQLRDRVTELEADMERTLETYRAVSRELDVFDGESTERKSQNARRLYWSVQRAVRNFAESENSR